MQIKPVSGFLPALDETREEERRKKKQEDRQKSDKATSPAEPKGPTGSSVVPAEESLSQISDSASLVKLLEKTQNADPYKANAFTSAKNSSSPSKKKLNKAL